MINPYITGVPVIGANFYGRQELVENLLDSNKSHIYLAGNRRMGKTSLLRLVKDLVDSPKNKNHSAAQPYYQRWPAPPEDVAIFYNLQGAGSGGLLKMGQDLARLAQKEGSGFRGLKKIKFPVDADLCQVIAILSDAAAKDDFRLVLLLDEAEKLTTLGDEALECLRSAIQSAPHVRTILAATKRLYELYQRPPEKTSPFLNGFILLTVSPLITDEAESLIRQDNQKKTVIVKDAQVQEILSLSGTHPYLIQNLCFDLYQSSGELRPIRGSDRTFSIQIANCFRDDYEALSTNGQAILHILAQRGSATRDELVSGLPPVMAGDIETHLKELLTYGNIVDKAAYKIAGQYLCQWLNEKPPVALNVSGYGLVEKYLDFDLKLIALGNNQYSIDVDSPAGQSQAKVLFPDLTSVRDLFATSNNSRLGREVGQKFFETVLPGDLRTRYELSRQQALWQGRGLRIRLHISDPSLIDLPWELLYDSNQAEFLNLSQRTPIIRYIDVPQSIQPLTVQLPLRVLCMLASPSDYETAQPEKEREWIWQATAALRQQGVLEVVWVEGQTWRDLRNALRVGPWQIFHFIGHGGFDNDENEGAILLADDSGKSAPLHATKLGRLLDHPSLRLVLLNSCSGGKGNREDVFSSTAATLVRRGLPAVIAMQQRITNTAALEFSRTFYETLSGGAAVESCVVEARKAMSIASSTLEWSIPSLYLRTTDSVLFRMPAAQP